MSDEAHILAVKKLLHGVRISSRCNQTAKQDHVPARLANFVVNILGSGRKLRCAWLLSSSKQ